MQSLLKFITCGSVDDGKSTLIGHMLYDAKLLFADQERALELDSKVGSRNGEIDYSLLLDGLMAEREQGITIDVAYRYFTTERRSFIVADTPGHEEYTRNMAVGASFADLAIILVDASQGVLDQTRRHTRICALMGIKHMVFAVNKMDLIHYEKERYESIRKKIRRLASEFEFDSLCLIPVSATEGDNITKLSDKMQWYQGKPLLTYLEEIDMTDEDDDAGFIMPVQRVNRPDHTFRGFQGQIEAGEICIGDEVTVLPSKETAKIKDIFVTDRQADRAMKGQAVTIQLDREVDVSRGCVLYKDTNIYVSNLFTATLLWMDDQELVSGKNYFLKVGTRVVPATLMKIKYKIDINEGEHIQTDQVLKNEIAVCDISVANKIVFDKFKNNKVLGSFILIDRINNMTSACGVIEHTLRRSENLTWHDMDITREFRAKQKGQKPLTIWFTGLSGAGKSTLVNEVEKRLISMGKHTISLDGDNIRLGLNKNLGFKETDRIENIRRVSEVSKLMNDAGLISLTSFISPYARDRQSAREIIGDCFVEVYVSTPLEECEKRDVKGLYKKGRTGEIPNFTGISSPYEPPENPDIVIDTTGKSIEISVDYIMNALEQFL
ncbi:adenylyl-sulfate kinase [Anaerosacchariphilus polymeriproducens]|uniref:Adenylyl-sulfate kinase n=1 Tax=Anaerosacchariphilus polymeriproducens TaxID=1812858 RepID=A0A371AXL5_9FIRM|nr:adenylyl-sulfate kinase [Anaerosacchariphilus polymeriproducens]RDU24297.1 adenylyl-sulfate kinase [Anaerosacchariphilus polymeriproducens]